MFSNIRQAVEEAGAFENIMANYVAKLAGDGSLQDANAIVAQRAKLEAGLGVAPARSRKSGGQKACAHRLCAKLKKHHSDLCSACPLGVPLAPKGVAARVS